MECNSCKIKGFVQRNLLTLIGVAAVAALGMMDAQAQRRVKRMATDSVQKVTDKAEKLWSR